MSGWLTIVGGIGLWVVFELAGMALAPLLHPVGRAMDRWTNRWTVGLLWMGGIASLALMPWTSNAASPAVRALGLVAIMGLTPLALMGTLTLRDRRRTRTARLVAPRSAAARAGMASRRPRG
jgi:hypothetical protein